MNIMFDDITDEDFIEKNLMISDEEAKKIILQDKQDELDELNEPDKNSGSSELSTKSIKSSKSIKTDKTIKKIKIEEETNEEIKPIKYGFGKRNI